MKGDGTTLELVRMPGKPALQTSGPLAVPKTSAVGQIQVADEAGFAYLSGDIDFGATGRNEIFQNIKFIVLTEYFSVPLDREFGFDYSMVDKPMAIAEAVFSQEVAMRISLYEPRAQFRSIDFVRDEMVGKLSPDIKVVLLTFEEGPSLYRAAIAGVAGAAVTAPLPTSAVIATPEAFSGTITGLPGASGPAGTVTVGSTTTGPPGSDALVVNTGTPSAAVLDFTIPEGEKGEQGTGITIKGTVANHAALPATGNTPGDMWIASDTGHGWAWNGTAWIDCGPIQGPVGATGPTGATGPQGATGATGTAATIAAGTTITGAAGTNANVVNVGSSSAAVFNFTIPQGIQGVQGVQGSQGVQGIQGPTGNPGAAATVTVGTTTTGAAGSAANVTNIGTTSAAILNFTIPQGIQGVQGIQGIQGPTGPANVLTVSGTATGAPGTNANVVISGTTPAQSLAFTIPRGDAGPTGATGAAGQIWRGSWVSTTSYLANDAVEYQGSTYICTVPNTNSPPDLYSGSTWVPPLANTAARGSIAALPASNQAQYYARGDNTWQILQMCPKGSIWGLTISNNVADATNDIDIAAGQCAGSLGLVDIVLVTSITKQLDVLWAAGTNQGGRDTGVIGGDLWWHIFVIKNPTTGVVDALFSQSATAPTLPSGFTAFRRVGSLARVSGTLGSFLQVGDWFYRVPALVYSALGTRALSLLTVPTVPTGVITFPILELEMNTAVNGVGYFTLASGFNSAFNTWGFVAKQNLANAVGTANVTYICTNFSAQIYMGISDTSTPQTCSIYTNGHYDNRGKDGYSP